MTRKGWFLRPYELNGGHLAWLINLKTCQVLLNRCGQVLSLPQHVSSYSFRDVTFTMSVIEKMFDIFAA